MIWGKKRYLCSRKSRRAKYSLTKSFSKKSALYRSRNRNANQKAILRWLFFSLSCYPFLTPMFSRQRPASKNIGVRNLPNRPHQPARQPQKSQCRCRHCSGSPKSEAVFCVVWRATSSNDIFFNSASFFATSII